MGVPWDGPEDPVLKITPGGASVPGPAPQNGRPPPQPAVDLRKQEEDRRRLEAERQRQAALRAQQEQERRKRDEETKKRLLEQEQERLRKIEEQKQKKEAEEKRRAEGQAALAVRKVIQRVRVATPETFDALITELQEAQEKYLETMGSGADKVSREA